MHKLQNTEIAVTMAHVHYNACLTKKVHVGCGVFSITSQQEKKFKETHEPVMLRKWI